MKQKISPKIVSIVFSILVICFAVGFYIYAAWTEPTESPPGGNVDAPLNVGSDYQAKIGPLILNTGGANTGLIVDQGNVGIGTASPKTKLDVNGLVRVARYSLSDAPSASADNKGAMFYNTDDDVMYYSNGSAWLPMGGGGLKTTTGTYAGNEVTNRSIAHGLGTTPVIVLIYTRYGSVSGDFFFIYKDRGWIQENYYGFVHTVSLPNSTNFYVGNSASWSYSANASYTYYWTAFGE